MFAPRGESTIVPESGLLAPSYAAKDGGLARAVRPDEADVLGVIEDEAYTIEDGGGAVALSKVLYLKHGDRSPLS